jgi:hypothetical protein
MGYWFTFETGEGLRIREDGKGCRLWYLGEAEYDKAHDQADSAAEDARRAERRRLVEIAMTEPDPKIAGQAVADLLRTQVTIDRFKRGESVDYPIWPYYEAFATDA